MKKLLALLLALALCLGLTALAEVDDQVEVILDATVNDLHVRAARRYGDETEILRVVCTDADGVELWSRTAKAKASQGYSTDAFPGGIPNAPAVMIYAAGTGLAYCDLATGKIEWTLPTSKVDLGESLQHALAKDGTMVVGGYLSPDPVAIDINGTVLWRSDVGSDDIFWLDGIKLSSQGVAAHYDHLMGEGPGWVYFGWDGQKKGVEKE